MHYEQEFTIGIKDAQLFHQVLALTRWRKGILGFGVVAALVVMFYSNLLHLSLGVADMLFTMLLCALAAMAAITAGIALSARITTKNRIVRAGKGAYLQKIRIDGFGIHVVAAGKKSKVSFERLQKVQETTRAFYIFLSANQAWILPKDQMKNKAAECRQLRDIFSAVMASTRLKLMK